MISRRGLERVKGIEPSYEAWEAAVLPLNYTRGVAQIIGALAVVALRDADKQIESTGRALCLTLNW